MFLKRSLGFVVVLASLLFTLPAFAELPQVTNGISYLTSSQGASGNWDTGGSEVEATATTVSVMETLKLLNLSASSTYGAGASWLQAQPLLSVDYVAERIVALGLADGSVNSLIPALDALKGAWGGYDGYETDVLDTALALRALKTANYSDPTTINTALAFLTTSQNSDGGWGFCAGDDSNVYMTAVVTVTLEQFPQVTTIATAVGKGTNFLLANQNPDGGFGGSGSSVYETALAYIALAGNGQTQGSPLQNAAGFLSASQSADGSWNDDPYLTALAIRALFFSENKPAPPPSPLAGGTITGTVIDGVTKAKVKGLSVALASNSLSSTTTDASGNFTLPDVPAGSQTVNFSLSGYAAKSVPAGVAVGTVTSLGTVSVLSSYSTGTIEGTIYDPSGLPLSGVAIAVSGAWSGSATTGADGTFSFSYVIPGSVTLTAAKSGYQTFTGQGAVYARTTLTFSPRLSTTLPQGTTGTLVGRVVDSYWGLPIGHLPEEPGVKVKVAGLSVSPDDNGYFTIKGLAPNTYQVVVGMDGFATRTARVVIVPGVTTDAGTFRLEMSVSEMALTGTVTDVFTGAPIIGAGVSIVGMNFAGSSDSTGFYAMAGIPTYSQMTLKVTAPGYADKSYALRSAPWTQTLNATLAPVVPQASLAGTVIDAATGQPLPGVALALVNDGSVTATTKADGTFTFYSLQKGVQQVSLSLGGYTPRTLTTAVLAGAVTNVGKIVLSVDPLPASIQGTAWDATAKAPFAGVEIQASGTGSWQATTGLDGTFHLDNVAPGTIRVETGAVPKPNYFGAGITGDLAPGGVLVFNPSLTDALQPSATMAIVTDHPLYLKGDDVGIEVDLLNTVGEESTGTLRVRVSDPSGAIVFESNQAQTLAADATATVNVSYSLPSSAALGSYFILAEFYDANGVTLGGAGKNFGVATSQISVTPALPSVLSAGDNPLSFNLVNAGGAAVTSGFLSLSLSDPDGHTVWSGSPAFTLGVGESKTVTAKMTLPPLKLGTYTLSYAENDESVTGQATQVTFTNSLAVSGLFDNNSHRVRQIAGLTVTLQNTGSFNIDPAGGGIGVTVSVPDAGYTETKTLSAAPAVGSTAGSSLSFSFAIPATLSAGQHAGTVTVTLPSGSSTVQKTQLAILESSLALTPLQGSYPAGGTIGPVVSNSGGVDTSVQYTLSLFDAKSKLIKQIAGADTAVAGSALSLALDVPSGAVDGTYNLVVDYKDLNTGKEQIVPNSIVISGIKGILQVQTDKQAYLVSEAVSGSGTTTNSGTLPVVNGNLHLQVVTGQGSQRAKTWTTQADFQTGVRNGVDTYGVNDWIVPDDDFDGPTIDTNRWRTSGNASIQSGRLFLDTTTAPSSTQVTSKWYFDGDFDFQVDLASNNPTDWTGAGLNISDSAGTATFGIGTSKVEGYASRAVIDHVEKAKAKNGIVATSGKFRITRTSSTVVSYYWGGTSWTELLRYTSAALATPCFINFGIYRDVNYPGTTAAFDNLRINSGRILTVNQTVDSVRLLPLNDNFDDGVLNEDRWSQNGSLRPVESGGSLHYHSNNVIGRGNGLYHKVLASGDYRATINYRNFSVTPSLTDQGGLVIDAWGNGRSLIYNERAAGTSGGGQFVAGMHAVDGVYYGAVRYYYPWSYGSLRIVKNQGQGVAQYWEDSNSTWQTDWAGTGLYNDPMRIFIFTYTQESFPDTSADVDSYYINQGPYATTGTLNLKQDAGQTAEWRSISWNSSEPAGTSIKFRTRTADTSDGLATATWSGYITASGSPVTSPAARWIEVEATLATNDANATPLLNDLTVAYTGNPGEVLWQTDLPVNLAQGAASQLSNAIGTLGVTGKLYLQGTLTSTTGQTVATAEYPFYVEQGNIQLIIAPDKKIYRPGETVTVTGSVKNLSSGTSAAGLSLQVKGAGNATLYGETISLAAGGAHPFSFTTTAGPAGSYPLNAVVTQNATTLVPVSDQYDSADPVVSADLTAPDSASNDPFGISVSLKNSGILDATTGVRVTDDSGKVFDDRTITLAAGESRVLPYSLSITGTASYTATFSGDLTQTISKTVTYTPPAIPVVNVVNTKVAADKISYNPNERVTLSATVSATAAMENLSTLVTVSNGQGQGVYSSTYAIPILNQGQVVTYKNYWNTGSFPAGAYTVTLQVIDATGAVIGKGNCSLAINSPVNASSLLRAGLSLDNANLLSGEPLTVSYHLTNAGNIDLANVPISIRTVGVADQSVHDAVTNSATLAVGASSTGSTSIDTTNYGAKDYLVVLSATVGGVEETLAGSYFRIEGAPTMPALSAPASGTDVETFTPALTVSDASDPNNDALSYQFEVYSDGGLTTVVASGTVSETPGTTSWTVPQPLVENATYYWRARAYDGRLYSPWMAPVAFRVNTANDPPTAPTVSSPMDGGSVAVLTPMLTVGNASDPDSTGLTYDFEIASDPDFIQVVASENGIAGGDATTSWTVSVPLAENGTYYWRARADDWLIQGSWSQPARLFVNTANDPPSAPAILSPAVGSTVAALSTDVAIQNSTDPDSRTITYYFEADTAPTFDSPAVIRSGGVAQGDGTTLWRLSGLNDNTRYYLRVKASDGLAESPWSPVTGFFANTVNDPPSTPIPANPSNGAGVTEATPSLSVQNSSDPDGDPLTYEFEIYSDSGMHNLVARSGSVAESAATTGWQVPAPLVENAIYYWRARAFDGALYSDWTKPASFMVNTANDAPNAPALAAPAQGSTVATLTPALSVVNATDPEGDALSYDFEVYSGGALAATSTGIPSDPSGVTSWTPVTPLADNAQYQWRARAFDGESYGPWMDMAGFTVHLPSTTIAATVDFDPNTLNRSSNGTWVSVYIELPTGFKPADIDVSSIRLEGNVPAETKPYAIGDHDKDRIPDLMVKFKRSQVLGLLPDGDRVPVRVSGKVGGVSFEGVDFIRVIK